MRTLIDALAGGALMGKNEVEASQMLKNITLDNFQWPVESVVPKKQAGAYDLDLFTKLAAQVSTLSKQLQAVQQKGPQVSTHMVEESPLACDHCHGAYPTSQCSMMNSMGELTIEQGRYLSKFPHNQNFNPYAQSYNPRWKNNPNFSRKNHNAVNLWSK